MVCRNPLLAAERARKRSELIAAAKKKLQGDPRRHPRAPPAREERGADQ
jgi:hypothetical protein